MDTSTSENLKSEKFTCEKILAKIKCKYCDVTTDLRITLNDHVRKHHKTSHGHNTDLQIKSYPCGNCDFESYSLLVWRLHQNKCNCVCKENSNSFEMPCESAQSGFSEQHITGESKLNASKYCDNNAKRKGSLRTHISMEYDRENLVQYKCSQCFFKTVYRSSLKSHMNTQHGDSEEIKRFECHQCGYKSKHKCLLKNHIIFHHTVPESIKWFECHECGHKTKHKRNLERHIAERHTVPEEMKWFTCYQCGHKTKQKRNLKNHIVARHTVPEAINWFECHQCGYKAKQKTHLKKHIVAQHLVSEQRFNCDQCEYKTNRKGNLMNHIKRKHARDTLREFKCSHCSFKTVYKNSLEIHMFSQHGDCGGVKRFK